MTAVLDLPSRTITYVSAAQHESNILTQLGTLPKIRAFCSHLSDHANDIEVLVSHHLGLTSMDLCSVTNREEWIRGSFNVCVPVQIQRNGKMRRRVLMRFPMPHAFQSPSAIDELIGCQAATSVLYSEALPDIPLVGLYGFAFSDARTYTHVKYRPFYVRLANLVQRHFCSFLRRPVPSYYTSHPKMRTFDTPYVLQEFVEEATGTLLEYSWSVQRNDRVRRTNLFRGLSRLILSSARLHQQEIGSFTFHNNGTISLTRRPLTSTLVILESWGVPRVIDQQTTYKTVDAYFSDLFTYHDKRFVHHPNAAHDAMDCRYQMMVKTILRALHHHYMSRDLRNGPYIPFFTDLHPSNMFVDENWNITKLIDPDFMSFQPIEAEGPFDWLTDLGADQLKGDALKSFDAAREEFMQIFEEEEAQMHTNLPNGLLISQVWRSAWKRGTYWYCNSVTSINMMYTLFPHIRENFSASVATETVVESISPFWAPDSKSFVDKKVKDKAVYDQDLRKAFEETKP